MASGLLRRNMVSEDVEDFFHAASADLKWGDLSEDTVMNIGCRYGASTEYLLSMYPKVKRVINVDVLRSKIEKAATTNKHPNIEYHVANIEEKASIGRWEGQISKVVSSYGFQDLKSIEIGFQNVYDLLASNGEAAIYFTLRSPFFDWYKDISEDSKWSSFIKGIEERIPESHVKRLRPSYYRNMLEKIGFTVIVCEEVYNTYDFLDDDECQETALSAFIPRKLRREFAEDVLRIFLKHNERSIHGRLQLRFVNLVVIIIKEVKE